VKKLTTKQRRRRQARYDAKLARDTIRRLAPPGPFTVSLAEDGVLRALASVTEALHKLSRDLGLAAIGMAKTAAALQDRAKNIPGFVEEDEKLESASAILPEPPRGNPKFLVSEMFRVEYRVSRRF
jgi:hypothetical protein